MVVRGVILYGSMTRQPVVRVLALVVTIVATGCAPAGRQGNGKATIARTPFGRLSDGADVEGFTLTNINGMEVRTIPYGAIIVSVRVPDRRGHLDDVVLGFDSVEGYATKSPYFGAVVGRYGVRIAKGRFTLDGA